MPDRIKLSNTNKIIGGVCGGLGEYFDVDPVFVRIVAVILALSTGVGLIAYIVAWIIMPKQEEVFNAEQKPIDNSIKPTHASWGRYWPGMILVGLGVILLVREYGYWFDWSEFWPVALILLGLLLIFRRTSSSKEPESTQPNVDINKQSNTSTDNGGQL